MSPLAFDEGASLRVIATLEVMFLLDDDQLLNHADRGITYMSIARRPAQAPRLVVGAFVLCLTLQASACSSIADKVEEATEVGENVLPSSAGRSRLAESPASEDITALAAQVGAENVQLLDLTITTSTFVASVQDPAKPENVDAYALDGDGDWGSPAPVELIGGGDLEASLFSADDVAWDAIDGLADRALQEANIEGAGLNTIVVKRKFQGEVEISVNVDGTRGSARLVATADGTFVEMVDG